MKKHTTTRTKVKAQAVLIEDEAEFLGICNDVALLKQKKLALKGEIAAYAERLKREIKELDAQDKALTVRAEKYASAHREELLPKGKSRKTALAWWGYRAIQSAVKTLSGTNEAQAISLILEDGAFDYLVKYSYSLDKVGILNAYRKGIITDAQLKDNGLKIVGGEGEEFFLDLIDDVKGGYADE